MDERPANNPRHTFGRKTKRAAIQLEQFPIPIPEIFAIFVFGFCQNCIAHLRYKSGKTRWKNYG